MNILIRLLFIALLLGLGYGFLTQFFKTAPLEKMPLELPASVDVETSRSYLIPTEKTLNYTLSQSPQIIWISSSALLAHGNNKTANYPYYLDVSVYNKAGEVLFSNRFHHQSRAAKLVELKADSQIVPETFTSSVEQKLSAMENLHIKLPAGATRLVIAQAVKSEQIKDIAIRAYQFVQRSSRVDAIDLWQRLSQKQKQSLLEYYPFDTAFLTDQEKANLAEFRWQPLVPAGDENDDYLSILQYRIPGEAIARKQHLISQYQHHADAYKRVSFPIEVAGRYRLEGNHSFTDRDVTLYTSWFNKKDSWEKKRTYTFSSSAFQQELQLEPGLLTIKSSIPVSLDLFALTGFVEEHDHFSPAVLLLPEEALNYSITQTQMQTTPIQVQARAFAEQGLATGNKPSLTLSVFQQGQSIQQHSLQPEILPDEDSQLSHEEFYHWLGLAKKGFFRIPAGADRIQLSSDQPLLVSVYTRLANMPAIRVLPEEKRDWFDYPSGVPDWFSLRPDNWGELVNKGAIRLLRHYHRSLLAEQAKPDPDETYQSLLNDFSNLTLTDLMVQNPYPGQAARLEENISLNFAELSAFPELTMVDNGGRPQTHRLFFRKPDNKPMQIDWQINGTDQPPFWIAGRWGIVDQSVTGTGLNGQLSINTPGVEWWRSNVPREITQWQLRRAALLQAGESVLLGNQKQSESEILSMVVYTTNNKPVELELALEGLQRDPVVTDQYTIAKHQYQIQPNDLLTGYQLAGKRTIRSRQSISITLKGDIANTGHNIRISHKSGGDIYFALVKRVLKPTPIMQRYRMQEEH